MFLDLEGFVFLLHPDAEIHVQGRSLRSRIRVVSVLHITAGPLLVKVHVDVGLYILGVEVFDAVEAALHIHLGLRVAVFVLHV